MPQDASLSAPPEQAIDVDRDGSIVQAEVVEKKATKKTPSAKRVLEVFERVYPRWKQLVNAVTNERSESNGLERFDEGWVLTRIIARGRVLL